MRTKAAADTHLIGEDALGGTADHDIELTRLDDFHKFRPHKALHTWGEPAKQYGEDSESSRR